MHGFGGGPSSSFSSHQKNHANANGWILVNLDGRGNQFYDGVGEVDFFDVLTILQSEINVDTNRIYAQGCSMGGTGAYRLGIRHPDIFAAVAGVDGWGDYRLWHRHWYAPSSDPYAVEQTRIPNLELASGVDMAENTKNLNIMIVAHSGDTSVWPDNARNLRNRITALGYTGMSYTELAGGHCGPYSESDILNFLNSKVNDVNPTSVVYKTTSLEANSAYWVTIDRIAGKRGTAEGTAQIQADNLGSYVNVITEGIWQFTLDLTGKTNSSTVLVYVDGNLTYSGSEGVLSFYATRDSNENIIGWSTTDTLPQGLIKKKGLSGPIGDAFKSPFIVVYGTTGSATQNQMNLNDANKLVNEWNSWMKASISPVPDSSVTPQDIQDKNLILVGTRDSNSVIASIAAGLPISVTESTITLGMNSYSTSQYGTWYLYPNPNNQNKYVVITTGSVAGSYNKDNEALPWFYPDYVIFDKITTPQSTVQSPQVYHPDVWVEAGYFDNLWSLPPVPNQAPVANAGPDQVRSDADGSGGESDILNGSDSYDSDGAIVSYEWKEGSTTLGTTAAVMYNLSVGTHLIDLTVTDDDNATGTDSITLLINANSAPTANAGSDQLVNDNDNTGSELVTLNGSGSSDSDGTILSYEWKEGQTIIATGVTPQVSLTTGNHTIELTVTDNGGATASDNVVVTIAEGVQQPIVLFSDMFNEFSKWTESNEFDWNIENPSEKQVPGHITGNKVAHADACRSKAGCYLTMTNGVDASPVGAVNLSFYRYVDNELDSKEFLKVQVWNGVSWNQIAYWTNNAGDDDTWRLENIDITPYKNNNLKIRFISKESAAAEATEIDDVQITVK